MRDVDALMEVTINDYVNDTSILENVTDTSTVAAVTSAYDAYRDTVQERYVSRHKNSAQMETGGLLFTWTDTPSKTNNETDLSKADAERKIKDVLTPLSHAKRRDVFLYAGEADTTEELADHAGYSTHHGISPVMRLLRNDLLEYDQDDQEWTYTWIGEPTRDFLQTLHDYFEDTDIDL